MPVMTSSMGTRAVEKMAHASYTNDHWLGTDSQGLVVRGNEISIAPITGSGPEQARIGAEVHWL